MLFRSTVAFFVLFNTFPAPSFAAGASEVTVVGPTDDTAAFIAVRPVTTPMQPEVSPVDMTTMATVPEPEPQAQQDTMTAQPAAEEPQMQHGIPEMMTREGGMITGMPVTRGSHVRWERMVERIEIMMGRPGLTRDERDMLRGILMRTWRERMRGRRLHRRAMHTPRVTTPMVPTPETPRHEQPATKERPMVERPIREETPRATTPMVPTPQTPRQEPHTIMPTMERPMMEQPTMEQPMFEQPMTTPETEQVTPAASEVSVRGARFNTAVGDIEFNNAMLGREEARTVPRMALRDVDFNTFVGRLRAQHTELGRGEEPQWERVWMPRRRFGWMPRRRFEWMPRREFVREF